MIFNLLAGCQMSTESIILYAVLGVVLIGFFVWTTITSRKRQKQEQERVAAMKVGDKVKTIGGVCGVVIDIDEDENTFTLETGVKDKKSYVKFDKQAIYQIGSSSDNQEPEKEKESK